MVVVVVAVAADGLGFGFGIWILFGCFEYDSGRKRAEVATW